MGFWIPVLTTPARMTLSGWWPGKYELRFGIFISILIVILWQVSQNIFVKALKELCLTEDLELKRCEC